MSLWVTPSHAAQYFTDGQTVERSGNIVIAGDVPEPGTYTLLLTGLGVLMGKRRAPWK